MISSTRLNFHKFSSNARHEYIAMRRRWLKHHSKIKWQVPSLGKEVPQMLKRSSHGVTEARALWKWRFHKQRDFYTRFEWGFLICAITVDLILCPPGAHVLPRTMSSSHSSVQSSPLERYTAKNRCEKCVQKRGWECYPHCIPVSVNLDR